MFLKKIIFFSLLISILISCAELRELEEISEKEKRERGWECTYDGDGNKKYCNYILPPK